MPIPGLQDHPRATWAKGFAASTVGALAHGLRRDDEEENLPRHLLRAFLDHDERLLFRIPRLVCSMMEMGIDRILFSVDYPFAGKTRPAPNG